MNCQMKNLNTGQHKTVLSLVVGEGRTVHKITKMTHLKVTERTNFPFGEHVDAGNQLQQGTHKAGIKEDLGRHILQYDSYCIFFFFFKLIQQIRGWGDEDVGII